MHSTKIMLSHLKLKSSKKKKKKTFPNRNWQIHQVLRFSDFRFCIVNDDLAFEFNVIDILSNSFLRIYSILLIETSTIVIKFKTASPWCLAISTTPFVPCSLVALCLPGFALVLWEIILILSYHHSTKHTETAINMSELGHLWYFQVF